MMHVHLPAFYLGVQEELEKLSSFSMESMPVNENILPSIDKQTKWKYVRTKDGLKLSDGNLAYSFGGFPDEFPSEDTRISRLSDDNILDFDKDALSSGTAQIHRASPDNIYMTLADGAKNPTFMLQHEAGQNWRYSPSKKFLQKLKDMSSKVAPAEASPEQQETLTDSTLIDPASLFAGAEDTVKKAFELTNPYQSGGFLDAGSAAEGLNSLYQGAKNIGSSYIQHSAQDPLGAIASGLVVDRGVGAVRDMINPQRKINRMRMPPDERTKEEVYEPLMTSALPVLGSMALAAK